MTDILDGEKEPVKTSTENDEGGSEGEPKIEVPEYLKDIELDDNLKVDPSLKDFKNISDVLKSYVHGKKFIGADKIVVPTEATTEEEWADIFSKLGVPKELGEYKVKAIEEGKLSPEFFDKFKEASHKMGLLPKQANTLLKFLNDTTTETLTKAEEENLVKAKANLEELKTEWGKAYDTNIKKANYALSKFGDKDFIGLLKESGFSNNPSMIKFMHKIADSLSEEDFKDGINLSNTPKEAEAKMNKIRGDVEHPYNNKESAGHADAIKMMEELAKEAYGTK